MNGPEAWRAPKTQGHFGQTSAARQSETRRRVLSRRVVVILVNQLQRIHQHRPAHRDIARLANGRVRRSRGDFCFLLVASRDRTLHQCRGGLEGVGARARRLRKPLLHPREVGGAVIGCQRRAAQQQRRRRTIASDMHASSSQFPFRRISWCWRRAHRPSQSCCCPQIALERDGPAAIGEQGSFAEPSQAGLCWLHRRPEPSSFRCRLQSGSRPHRYWPASANPLSHALRPGLPCGPCGPGAPVAPVSPCGPCGPTSPCSPCGPCGPASPCGPCAPVAPVSPCGPCAPSHRLHRFRPADPAGRLRPADPVPLSHRLHQ